MPEEWIGMKIRRFLRTKHEVDHLTQSTIINQEERYLFCPSADIPGCVVIMSVNRQRRSYKVIGEVRQNIILIVRPGSVLQVPTTTGMS